MNATEKTTGAVNRLRKAQPYRGPIRSQITPIIRREKMLPETEATPALPMSERVRFRLSRIMGTKGAAAKVEMKQVKNEIQPKWKDLMWGCAKEKILRVFALCSESTGRENLFAPDSEGFAIEKVKGGCSLPLNPCKELPLILSAIVGLCFNKE